MNDIAKPEPKATEEDPIIVVDGTGNFEAEEDILDDIICQILGDDEASTHGFKRLPKND